MANLQIRDGAGAAKYVKVNEGAGTDADPFIPEHHAVITSDIDNHVDVGIFGELITGQKKVEISVRFDAEINTTYDVTSTLTGDGAVNHVGNVAQITSTTGTAKLRSKDTLIYENGRSVQSLFTASFNGSGIGKVGLYDNTDGIYFTYNNGALSVSYENGGSATTVTSGSFNGHDISGIDFTKINVFKISFGYLGVAPITVEVMDSAGHYKLIHRFNIPGTLTTTHIGQPTLPVTMETSGAMTILTGSWSGFVIDGGSEFAGTRPFSFPVAALTAGATSQGQVTLSGTNVSTLAVFHNKTTYNSRINKKKARLLSYNFSVDISAGSSYGVVVFQMVANPTLSGAATYSDIETTGSVIEYDHVTGTGASVSYASGGKVILNEHADYVQANKGGAVGEGSLDAERIGAVTYPGDTFAILAKDLGGNNATVRFSFTWEEA